MPLKFNFYVNRFIFSATIQSALTLMTQPVLSPLTERLVKLMSQIKCFKRPADFTTLWMQGCNLVIFRLIYVGTLSIRTLHLGKITVAELGRTTLQAKAVQRVLPGSTLQQQKCYGALQSCVDFLPYIAHSPNIAGPSLRRPLLTHPCLKLYTIERLIERLQHICL